MLEIITIGEINQYGLRAFLSTEQVYGRNPVPFIEAEGKFYVPGGKDITKRLNGKKETLSVVVRDMKAELNRYNMGEFDDKMSEPHVPIEDVILGINPVDLVNSEKTYADLSTYWIRVKSGVNLCKARGNSLTLWDVAFYLKEV